MLNLEKFHQMPHKITSIAYSYGYGLGAKVITFQSAFLIFLWSSQYLDEGNFSYIRESPVKLHGVEEASRRASQPTRPVLEQATLGGGRSSPDL